jgi:hypothetical protein
MSWTIKYFRTRGGVMPARDFRRLLPAKLRSKLDRYAAATAANEGAIGGGIFQSFHAPYAGLSKVRARHGPDLARYLCAVDGDSLILLDGVQKRINQPAPPLT